MARATTRDMIWIAVIDLAEKNCEFSIRDVEQRLVDEYSRAPSRRTIEDTIRTMCEHGFISTRSDGTGGAKKVYIPGERFN